MFDFKKMADVDECVVEGGGVRLRMRVVGL